MAWIHSTKHKTWMHDFRSPAAQQVFLVDPPGSSLFNRVKRGVLYAREEAEGTRLKNPFDTMTEGLGINRITANFRLAQVCACGPPAWSCQAALLCALPSPSSARLLVGPKQPFRAKSKRCGLTEEEH
jgi:hypothetical protein